MWLFIVLFLVIVVSNFSYSVSNIYIKSCYDFISRAMPKVNTEENSISRATMSKINTEEKDRPEKNKGEKSVRPEDVSIHIYNISNINQICIGCRSK